MGLKINEDKCKGCGLCIEFCPSKVLNLNKDKINKKGYNPVKMETPDKCRLCGICYKVCPDVVFEVGE
ncbi:indolepyruvate ferredoxin oxidoreductase subunit alpha [Caldicellulosiruptoraceae bacterium PP1]